MAGEIRFGVDDNVDYLRKFCFDLGNDLMGEFMRSLDCHCWVDMDIEVHIDSR